ncbi:MAG: RsmD family RNA methyltransferase [Termitinemataceae bacterium]|nr:MAG: RsmD family RNA methyltransferase [Termitinemataceae bacterium]
MKDQFFTCRAEKLALSDGSMLASVIDNTSLKGKKFFVPRAAPGDILLCKEIISESPKNRFRSRAQIVEVIEKSAQRCVHACTYYDKCGGCTLQHINYDAQIELKIELLKDKLQYLLHENVPEIKVNISKPYEYRNRVQFHKVVHSVQLGGKKRLRKLVPASTTKQSVCGFMTRHGNDIIPVNDCPVCDPVIRGALQSSENILTAPLDNDRWTVYGKDGILLSENGSLSGQYTFCGKQVKITAAGFFQCNGQLLEALIPEILLYAKNADPDLCCGDFYCGVGTFAVFLQDYFNSLVLFDQNKIAMNIARENLKTKTKASHIEFCATDDTSWAKSRKSTKQFGFVVVDPSREGLSSVMCNWICESKPKIVCYVSCNPAALERDAKYLLNASYKLESLSFYDFYPQTAHIESLAVFKCR